jgi:two-component system chemotaxis sensor kinase CheA
MFYEEARELLISLEEGLMDLERRQADRAHLDRTFRAAHSLKGAAGMVGLKAVSEFTHSIEAVLERIRGGLLAVDSDIITTLLESRDHLAAMVEAEAAKSSILPSAELTQRLTALVRGPAAGIVAATSVLSVEHSTAPVSVRLPDRGQRKGSRERNPTSKPGPKKRRREASKPLPTAVPAAAGPGQAAEDAGDEALTAYEITLTPGPDVLRRGVNPLGVLDELRELGETSITTDPDLVPPLDQLDPERCYLSWTITVKTTATPERLREAFLFFAEDSTVTLAQRTRDGKLVPIPGGPIAPAAGGAVIAPGRPPAESPAAVVGPGAVVQPALPLPSATEGAASPHAVAAAGLPSAVPGAANTIAALPRPHPRIRVDAAQLDELVGLAGELVVIADNLLGLREIPAVESWGHALESLERISREIRDTTLDLRMVPVDELFSRFPRVVRDLADRSGKEIDLRIIGQETRLDRTIVERLSDPMIHLIRNAVDHALEHPLERLEKGKPRLGRITLWAGHEGDRVAIRVEDDGRGLDRDKIVRKGIALGMIPMGTPPEDPRVVSLIFEPGFSTRDTISDLSGRGVGLDVVRDAVRALRGSVAVESTPGKGTSFIFRLPLTLALIDGLLVETGGGRFVVPLAQVEECVALNGTKSALSDNRPCVSVRGEFVPMVSLRSLFQANGPLPARQELLLTRHAGQRVGVAVDRLLGRVQAVIQSLGEGMHGLNRFSGATILGDGSVSLILDLSALVSESRFAAGRR